MERAIAASICVGTGFVGLDLLIEREDMFIVPALAAERGPAIKIGAVTAHPQHSVDRTRAADNPPGRPCIDDPGSRLIGFPAIGPVVLPRHSRDACGNTNVRTPVATARFQDQYLCPTLTAEPVRHHAAGRAGPDNDVVPGVRRGQSSSSIRAMRGASVAAALLGVMKSASLIS